MTKKILGTDGAGFVRPALVRHAPVHACDDVVKVDQLTYLGNIDSLADESDNLLKPIGSRKTVMANIC